MSNSINISEVQITLIKPHDGLIAFASLVINNQFYLGSIGVHRKISGGYRLTYPTKKSGENNVKMFHPINVETSDCVEREIFGKLENMIIPE